MPWSAVGAKAETIVSRRRPETGQRRARGAVPRLFEHGDVGRQIAAWCGSTAACSTPRRKLRRSWTADKTDPHDLDRDGDGIACEAPDHISFSEVVDGKGSLS
ncbi:excalibur calcium-binding domain-containing protein [Nonomuraea recticatena]|uniref:Excalibur calcium-binding domain-containing protein n=1 Tax=Nonomuraea recticatena TaxID=46178 RepID=A0ABN3SPV5_9ACTN